MNESASPPPVGRPEGAPTENVEPIYSTKAYDYRLPPELIAQEPPRERGKSRLLCVDRESGVTTDGRIDDVLRLLRAGDVLVLNDTKVVKARLEGVRADTGGRVEMLFHRFDDGIAEALTKTRAFAPAGTRVVSPPDGGPAFAFEFGEKDASGVRPIRTGLARAELLALLEARGRTPLPPYIRREKGADAHDADDEVRYQTVFARTPGAAAAPTAGLHLTQELLAALAERGVRRAYATLHVGLGTFKPVEVEDLRAHAMHEETYELSAGAVDEISAARAAGGRVVAIGTTAVRILETCAAPDGALRPGAGTTKIFLHPPYRFRAVDALLTNFHVPQSTLLMLVSAFLGREKTLAAYRHAVAARYRFLSYGDAMFIA
jgi:S-adenosylmethionine:tRNA ribosyltransferase-isomerase